MERGASVAMSAASSVPKPTHASASFCASRHAMKPSSESCFCRPPHAAAGAARERTRVHRERRRGITRWCATLRMCDSETLIKDKCAPRHTARRAPPKRGAPIGETEKHGAPRGAPRDARTSVSSASSISPSAPAASSPLSSASASTSCARAHTHAFTCPPRARRAARADVGALAMRRLLQARRDPSSRHDLS